MMEVFLELASSVVLTLLVFHIFGKFVTSSTLGASTKFGDGKMGILRGFDSVTGKSGDVQDCGGSSPPGNFSGISTQLSSLEIGEGSKIDDYEFPEEKFDGEEAEELVEIRDVLNIAHKLLDESSGRDGAGVFEECLSEKDETDVTGFEELIEVRDSDEEGDDWVGIESADLERIFSSAIAFIGSSGECNRVLTDDVKTKLYGLHKVATQGRCLDPKPMAFKVSPRAKWNAWQELGEMAPEMAMEQYVLLLSKSIPKWMDYELKGDGKQVLVDTNTERKLEEIPPSD